MEFDPVAKLLSADYDPDDNGVPEEYFNNRVCRWYFQRPILADAANALMAEIRGLAERIATGYTCEHDGQNYVGRYNDDAQEAIDTAQSMIDERDTELAEVISWDAGEWLYDISLSDVYGLRADMDNLDLAVIADAIIAAAAADGITELTGLDHYLRQQRDDLNDEVVEEPLYDHRVVMKGTDGFIDYDGREVQKSVPSTFAGGKRYDYIELENGVGINIHLDSSGLIQDNFRNTWYSVEDAEFDENGEFVKSQMIGYARK